MPNNYDNLTFEGNLGSDASMAFGPDGSPYTRFQYGVIGNTPIAKAKPSLRKNGTEFGYAFCVQTST